MKIIFVIFAVLISMPFTCLPSELIPTSMFCSTDNPDFKGFYQDFPKCRRNVPYWIKKEVYRIHRIPPEEHHLYTIDHVISLFCGGSNYITNLNPQLRSKSTSRIEYQLFLKLRSGELCQEEVINILLKIKGYIE